MEKESSEKEHSGGLHAGARDGYMLARDLLSVSVVRFDSMHQQNGKWGLIIYG